MDHSIEAYLERRTTEELERLLDSYSDDENGLHQYYATLIKKIFEKRNESQFSDGSRFCLSFDFLQANPNCWLPD